MNNPVARMARVSVFNLVLMFVVGVCYMLFVGRVSLWFHDLFGENFTNTFFTFSAVIGVGSFLVWITIFVGHLNEIYNEDK